MSTVTLANNSYAVDEVVSALFFENFFDEPFTWPMLFDIRTSDGYRERLASMGGLTEFSLKTEGAAVTEDSVTQQYEKDITMYAFGKQLPVSREWIDDQRWGMFTELSSNLGYMASYSMEKYGASLFNDAFAGASFTAEDGKSLCNDAHTNSDSANSQDNSFTNTLNFAGLETCRVAMRKFTNYRGDKMIVRPDLIVVPTDLEQTGWELIKSIGKPDTTNNNLNYYQGRFDMIVWDFLTDTNAWFMIDKRLMKMNLIWFQRIAPEVFGDGDLFKGTRRIGGYYRIGAGVRDWRWIAGNNPS